MMLFFELLQISLGRKSSLSRIPTEKEWQKLYLLSKQQTLLGVAYTAIGRLPADQRPPRQLLLQWGVNAELIKERNEALNRNAVEISQKFQKDGFRNIILKGQGVAQYYKIDHLELYRMPGDVDIWLDGRREDIISYVRQYIPNCFIVYHHVDFPKIGDVEIEVHFTPSWMNCYFTNIKLQRFFSEYKKEAFANNNEHIDKIPTPSLAFNRVYILIHIYRHLFQEGIGLRQLMDYYYVLRQGFTEKERKETMDMLCSLKMQRFTGAVMWVLQEVFGMEERYLLAHSNEKDGRFLLSEIVRAGNFGQYDKTILRKHNESNLHYGLRKVKRNFRFLYSYPSEVLWSPIFKIWHYFWRKRMNRR